jgi:ribonuclease E
MLVSVAGDHIQIAVLVERELVEHYVTHSSAKSIVGNVYLGKVQNVLPGMEAAFIEIGEARNAVLYAGELDLDEEIEGEPARIETMLKSGQPILAQVTKDPMGSKGARLTTEVSLAGRYVVLVPATDLLGISRRLSDTERDRLKAIAAKVKPGHGLIVRTAAEGVGEDELTADITRLEKLWSDIQTKQNRAKPPKLLYSEPELVIRVVRDLFTSGVEKVLVDEPGAFRKISDYINEVTPELGARINLYEDPLPLFERHHVIEQLRKALDRKVWLPSGGHIVIDRTEAMTVVDVNTGRFVGKSTLEETVLKTNLEAAEEIAKQLRLRDIGGIIVIDFIDMLQERNRESVGRTLRDALSKDKTRNQVFPMSELGLVQMTRKNVSEGLLEAFSVTCEACSGRGILLTELS